MKKRIALIISALLLAAAFAVVAPKTYAKAAGETAVSISYIDYESLNMRVHKNGNKIVYYSTDAKKTWQELEGKTVNAGAADEYLLTDISWISSTAETTVYFKGDVKDTNVSVKFPKQNAALKIKYDKANVDFTFSNCDDAVTFLWRKNTDFNWREVCLPDADQSKADGVVLFTYASFKTEVEKLLVKGAKICIRTAQTDPSKNTGSDPGERPSKEVMVAVAKRANAPAMKLNIVKLTVNTKETIEYYDEARAEWVSCTKNMTLEELTDKVFYSGAQGAAAPQAVSLKFRTAATGSKPYSKTFVLALPAQTAPPTVGDSTKNVTIYEKDEKTVLKFNDASKTKVYEYCIIKDGGDLEDQTKVSWKTVKNNKEIKLSQRTAPEGASLYIRYKGSNANKAKGLGYVLPSDTADYTV